MAGGGEPRRRVERMAGVMIDGLLGAATGFALVAAAPRLGFKPAPPAAAGQGPNAAVARRAHNRRTVALVIAASGALAALVHVAENGLG
jgi:hypothetical protein